MLAEGFQQALIGAGVHGQLVAQRIQRGQAHRQALDQRLGQARRLRRLVEHTGGSGRAQAFAQLGHLPRAGLHFAQAEHAGMAQAVGRLEIVVGLVEHEVGLVRQRRQSCPQALVQRVQTLLEGRQVGPVARGIGRIARGQVVGHARGDHPGIGRQQPEVGIQAAGAMVVVVIVMRRLGLVILVVIVMIAVVMAGMRVTEVPQLQARQRLHGQAGRVAALQQAGQEALQVRPDPVEQRGLAQATHLGGLEHVVVRGRARRQQHVGRADTVLHGGGDQLQGLDAGEQRDFGTGSQRSQTQQQNSGQT